MRISFVIPAYNEENYLPACLESILAQTSMVPHLSEIIVVNNASSDRTREIALSYPGVTLVDEPRKGLTYARQAGFCASSGDLIANVDSDSRLTPDWLETVLAAFDEDHSLVALSGPVVFYDLPPRQRLSVQIFYLLAYFVYFVNRYIVRAGSMVQGGNFILSSKALKSIGGFNLSIPFYGEDTDIARRMNRVGKVQFTLRLKMFSSARRLKNEGMMRIALRYTINYLWTTFRKRPFTEEYLDHRDPVDAEA